MFDAQEAKSNLTNFVTVCMYNLENAGAKRFVQSKRLPKNAISRDFKHGAFTLRYMNSAIAGGNLNYATEMLRVFIELTWEEQQDNKRTVLKAIIGFTDSIITWQEQALFIVKSFYCTYFDDIYDMILISAAFMKRHPLLSRQLAEWVFEEIDSDNDWMAITFLKAVDNLPYQGIVTDYIFDTIEPTSKLFEMLLKVPTTDYRLLDRFYGPISSIDELVSAVQPLFTETWNEDQLKRLNITFEWIFMKMIHVHPCRRPFCKLVSIAEQCAYSEIHQWVDTFSKKQLRKRFKSCTVDDNFLKVRVLEAVRQMDVDVLICLFSCYSKKKAAVRIRRWNLMSLALVLNAVDVVKALVVDLGFEPIYDDIKMCSTQENFEFYYWFLGKYLKPLEVATESIYAGMCPYIYQKGILFQLDESELQEFMMFCCKYRSLKALNVVVQNFPRIRIPFAIHNCDPPWIEAINILICGFDEFNDFAHSVYCLSKLQARYKDQYHSNYGVLITTTNDFQLIYFLKVLSYRIGITHAIAEYMFHPYVLHCLNSIYLKSTNKSFNSTWNSLKPNKLCDVFE